MSKFDGFIFENWPRDYRWLNDEWVKAERNKLKAWKIQMAEELFKDLTIKERAKKLGLTYSQYLYRRDKYKKEKEEG